MEKKSPIRRLNKWPIIVLVLGAFLFYWYALRPITVYRSCAQQASTDARTLLASKATLAAGTTQGESFNKLIEQNLYLRTDYESFLMKCLMYHGMQISPLDPDTVPPSDAVDMPRE